MASKTLLALAIIVWPDVSLSQGSGQLRYENRSTFSPNDYLLRSRNEARDAVFERYQAVDLGVNLGIGSDCGRVDFKNTLRSSLTNMLDSKYFGDLGKNIIAASPMLATCYFSPTWCAILKHSQLSANFMAQMRLDQCSLVDKYTDSRVDDFYQERQSCVRQSIDANGGDLESAMDSCRNVWGADLASWGGGTGKVQTNKLIESSAAWAGYTTPAASRSVDLLKAFVGDTTLARGTVSVEYGSRATAMTPEKYLQELRLGIHTKLCRGLVPRAISDRGTRSLNQSISDLDLKAVSGDSTDILVDRQTIEALSYMPELQREAACQKLSEAVATVNLTKDLGRSLDILTVSTQNPHLPPHRRSEIEAKRKTFKESIEMTLALQRERSEPVNLVISEINSEGAAYRADRAEDVVGANGASHDAKAAAGLLIDCADGIFCGGP